MPSNVRQLLEGEGSMEIVTDLLILAAFGAFMGFCALYVLLADRMVSGR